MRGAHSLAHLDATRRRRKVEREERKRAQQWTRLVLALARRERRAREAHTPALRTTCARVRPAWPTRRSTINGLAMVARPCVCGRGDIHGASNSTEMPRMRRRCDGSSSVVTRGASVVRTQWQRSVAVATPKTATRGRAAGRGASGSLRPASAKPRWIDDQARWKD